MKSMILSPAKVGGNNIIYIDSCIAQSGLEGHFKLFKDVLARFTRVQRQQSINRASVAQAATRQCY